MAICSAIVLAHSRVVRGLSRVDFGARGGDQLVDQVVGLDAKAFAPADFNVGFLFVLFRNVVAKLNGAARRERDHLVAEVRVVIGLFGISHAAERLDDIGLRVRLARVDDVVDRGRAAEARMVRLTRFSGDPAFVVGIREEAFIAEVLAEQSELPKMIGNVFADVGDGAVRADDDLGIFVGRLRLPRRRAAS